MKCINCFREIEDGIKFCPKCGFLQPEDREAYEREHPELADALPEDEIMRQVEMASTVPVTAMSREELELRVISDPYHDSIMKMVDEGVAKFGLHDTEAQQTWYAKCGELINDKQGFYPYFVILLSQQYEKARDLIFNQASYGLNVAASNAASSESINDDELPPELPALPPLPTHDELLQDELMVNNESPLGVPNDANKDLIECPICHNMVSAGAKECPFCHQQLDWNSLPMDNTEEEAPRRNTAWIVPAVLLTIFLGAVIVIGVYQSCKRERQRELERIYDNDYDYNYNTQSVPVDVYQDDYDTDEDYDDYDDYEDYDDYGIDDSYDYDYSSDDDAGYEDSYDAGYDYDYDDEYSY